MAKGLIPRSSRKQINALFWQKRELMNVNPGGKSVQNDHRYIMVSTYPGSWHGTVKQVDAVK